MRLLFTRYLWWYVLLLVLFAVAVWFGWLTAGSANGPTVDSVEVAIGDVVQSVTVSGKVEVKEIARLGFPVTGTIQDVYKDAGDRVEAGDVIASLTTDSLIAEYNAARERVRYYEKQKSQLLQGAKTEERAVASQEVSVAEATLEKTIREYDKAIENAWQNLLATDLQAYPTDKGNNDIPPTISGNYLCDEVGEYKLELFGSAAQSNLSYRLTGMATGTFSANVVTPEPLGDCGLYIQFDDTEVYRDEVWTITIPNKRGSSYVALKNAYELLLTQRETAVNHAKQQLAVVRGSEQVVNSFASAEELAQADASIAEATEQLAIYAAKIADYTIRMPFTGVISSVDMKVGEPVGPQHTVTVVNEGGFDVKAKVPEIDITKIAEGAPATVLFDAAKDKVFTGTVTFISPVSTDVSGVSYYDAYISLEDAPGWMREGLNADITITAKKVTSVPSVPKRYIVTDSQGSWVFRQTELGLEKVAVQTGLVGTDDIVEVSNLSAGTVLVLPE